MPPYTSLEDSSMLPSGRRCSVGQTTVVVECYWCKAAVEKVAAEVRRQQNKGNFRFFCSRSCSAAFRNAKRPDRRKPVTKTCPQCGDCFETMSGAKSATFCSRACASAGSVTAARISAGKRNAKNLEVGRTVEAIADKLWSREQWKYEKLQELLDFLGEAYDFEHPLAGTSHIFDLALPDRKLLVEFDSKYHDSNFQRRRDKKKEAAATSHGWKIRRIRTPVNEVIDPSVLHPILKE